MARNFGLGTDSYGKSDLKLMSSKLNERYVPAPEDLEKVFRVKYGSPENVGWSPRRRFRFGYYLPSDFYEAAVEKYVFEGCAWIDIGGGRAIFPENPKLANLLALRCSLVVAVDSSDNVYENETVHRRVRCSIEDYKSDRTFDLVTMRMVAEHVTEPEKVISALQRLLRPGGIAIIFTVNLYSPITLVSRLVPQRLHHPVKKLFWGGEEKDTFPTQYRMNTRKILKQLFEERNFQERAFLYLDDLALFRRFRYLGCLETALWWVISRVGVRYPENCLLGVYQRQ
jgi:2-polyprenyl-3-methyl-5-hydroxy-6-metoxy-1,4-benzoquinol methylase